MTTTFDQPALLPARPLVWICRILCAVALCISGYLAWTAFNATEVYGCGGGEVFDCGHVLNSRYSKIFGLPVSVPAFGIYASLLASLVFFRPGAPEKLLRFGWALLTIGAFSAGLAALWFISIQVFELQHLCAYCLGAHSCGLILAAIIVWKRPLGWIRTSQFFGISVAGVAVLIAGQLMSEPPPTFTIETYGDVDFAAPETQLTSFAAPEGPQEFDAPLEFAPPVEAADVFAAPVIESPGADNLFAPPADAVEANGVTESAAPVVDEPATGKDQKADVTSDLPEAGADVSAIAAAEVIAEHIPRHEEPRSPVAVTAYLFFSASGNSVVSRLLTAIPELDDVSPSDTATSDDGEAVSDEQSADEKVIARTVTKPVAAAPVKQRLVVVAGNKFSLNTRHWPLLGDPDAKYVFVEMFDYTCPHCRHTHQAIEGAFNRFGDDLAVIALPVPLERSCNDASKGTGHVGACDQAKLAVAVWRCDRSKFREFHHWMFDATRTTAQARSKAEALVGKEKLTAELALPYAAQYVSKHVDLYKRVGSGAVPKLMFPGATLTGEVSSSRTLVSTIERELAKAR